MRMLLQVAVQAVAIWVATLLLSGIEVIGGDSTGTRVLTFVAVAVVFGLVNGIVKPIVKVISFPLYLLTLGLFSLVVNALMLMLVGWISEWTEYGLRVASFGNAVVGGFIIAIVTVVLSVFLPRDRK
ncbi:phage holin family protein [Actinotalea sp. M2MS4P-6]|uniref:phage holin family protein n=1 Tax=Actinotalea sp. M2MS4P-6 TaxID=2983762 RepID=UPI0021E37C8C|nr:phage holin family protein [Actinotalea sp. M2MS4P-6]MCV2392919.1 phage holin family protein [Actinotalea sp. M2MS4P-6]